MNIEVFWRMKAYGQAIFSDVSKKLEVSFFRVVENVLLN